MTTMDNLLFLAVTSWILYVVTSQCIKPGSVEFSLQERLYQADIILFGQDMATETRCPAQEPNCATTDLKYREYSNFLVYCVIKNNSPRPVPKNFTIFPRKFGDPCLQTTFSKGVSGWVHLVTVTYEAGRYYWDEINDMAAYSTIYLVNTDDKLKKAAELCNLPVPKLPEGGSPRSDVGCPVLFNKTRDQNTCFKGCQRGWKPIGRSCYWFSDPEEPVIRNEAAASCLLQDAHLMSMETQEEETRMTYVLNEHVDTEWWTSGMYRGALWVWQDGIQDVPVTYTNWRRAEPAGERGQEDYIVMWYRRDKWGWRAVTQDIKLPYICEKERGERPPITRAVCEDRNLQSTREGRALCALAVQKWLLTSGSFRPNMTSQPKVMCQGRTAYDDINCLRDVKRGDDFVTTLTGKSAFNPYVGVQELTLTFASLPGNLVVCGQQYSWPTTVVVRPHLGDVKSYPSWHFREESKMAVTWDAEKDHLYSLLILDLDLLAVHGAWVNIPGGNLTAGQVVQEYVPLAVATPAVPASFAFMVFRQKAPAFLTDDLLGLLTYSIGRRDDFNLTRVTQEVGLEDLVAVNFLTVEWDPYAAWYFQQTGGYTNHCPHYVQMAYRDLSAPVLPPQVPFSVVMDVMFEAGPEQWDMCCKQFSVGSTSAHLDPYGVTTVTLTTEDVRLAPSMNVTRGNVLLDGRDRRQTFRDDWYTIVMVDIGIQPNSAPPSQITGTPLLHWLVIDVPDGNVTAGRTMVPYKTPAPIDKFKHFYVIYAFKQKLKLGVVNSQRFSTEDCSSDIRCAFNLTSFVRFYDLDLAGANWFTVEADIYALYTLIQKKLSPPADACQRMFPDTETYGPIVICKNPTPAQPNIRPIISSGAPSGRKVNLMLPLQLISILVIMALGVVFPGL